MAGWYVERRRKPLSSVRAVGNSIPTWRIYVGMSCDTITGWFPVLLSLVVCDAVECVGGVKDPVCEAGGAGRRGAISWRII